MQLHDTGQTLRPVTLVLARQPVHQIQGNIVKSRSPGCSVSFLRLFPVVAAADHFQQIVLHRLHPDREAVHPFLTHLPKILPVHGVGIAFHGDLSVDTDVPVQLQHIKEFKQTLRAVVTRGASAEIDAVYFVVAD